MSKDAVEAPWTEAQVERLRDWQQSGYFHPYTCPNRDNDHTWTSFGGDYGVLIPTKKGWVCNDCDYKQTWAHSFSFEPVSNPLQPFL